MSLLAGLHLRVFSFGVLAASVYALKFDFADQVQQCDQVTISFSGSNLTEGQIPASLEILPINSSALNIPLSDPSLVDTGIALTFLPFPAGTDFIASLDNSTGENIIGVSDIIRVLSSPSANDTCLPSAQDTTRLFSLPTNVSQCEEFTIEYDTSLVQQPPSVRLYNPKGPSFALNMTSSNQPGEATYLMSFSRQKEVVLLMSDGNGHTETSPLFTVGGDANSDTSCLRKKNSNSSKMSDRTTDMPNTPSTSKALIIGVASGGSAVVLIAIGMLIFVVRERRRRRRNRKYDFDPSKMQLPPDNEKNTSGRSPSVSSTRVVPNPIYTSEAFMSPTRSNYQRGSLASAAQVMREDATRRAGSSSMPSSEIIVQPPAERSSLDSFDIEGMLNMATLQNENAASRKSSEATVLPLAVPDTPTPLSSTHLTVPTRTVPRPDDRRQRSPSNVPRDFDSLSLETYSLNPFDSRESITPSLLQNNLQPVAARRPTPLPTSPRDSAGVESTQGRILSGLSAATFRSSTDWYGVAR